MLIRDWPAPRSPRRRLSPVRPAGGGEGAPPLPPRASTADGAPRAPPPVWRHGAGRLDALDARPPSRALGQPHASAAIARLSLALPDPLFASKPAGLAAPTGVAVVSSRRIALPAPYDDDAGGRDAAARRGGNGPPASAGAGAPLKGAWLPARSPLPAAFHAAAASYDAQLDALERLGGRWRLAQHSAQLALLGGRPGAAPPTDRAGVAPAQLEAARVLSELRLSLLKMTQVLMLLAADGDNAAAGDAGGGGRPPPRGRFLDASLRRAPRVEAGAAGGGARAARRSSSAEPAAARARASVGAPPRDAAEARARALATRTLAPPPRAGAAARWAARAAAREAEMADAPFLRAAAAAAAASAPADGLQTWSCRRLLSLRDLHLLENHPRNHGGKEAASAEARGAAGRFVGFSRILRALSDLHRVPLPTATDPFSLRVFDASSLRVFDPLSLRVFDASARTHARAHAADKRDAPPAAALARAMRAEAWHTPAELAAFKAAEAFLHARVLGRQRLCALGAHELALPTAATPDGWRALAALLHGGVGPYAAARARMADLAGAVSRIAMAFRRHAIALRAASRRALRLTDVAVHVQYHARRLLRRMATLTAELARTGETREEYHARLRRELRAAQDAARAERARLALVERRRLALLSALDDMPRYQAAIVTIQARARGRAARRVLAAQRARAATFAATIRPLGRRFETQTVRWQAAARRWRAQGALCWSEYERVGGPAALHGRAVLAEGARIDRIAAAAKVEHSRALALQRRELAKLARAAADRAGAGGGAGGGGANGAGERAAAAAVSALAAAPGGTLELLQLLSELSRAEGAALALRACCDDFGYGPPDLPATQLRHAQAAGGGAAAGATGEGADTVASLGTRPARAAGARGAPPTLSERRQSLAVGARRASYAAERGYFGPAAPEAQADAPPPPFALQRRLSAALPPPPLRGGRRASRDGADADAAGAAPRELARARPAAADGAPPGGLQAALELGADPAAVMAALAALSRPHSRDLAPAAPPSRPPRAPAGRTSRDLDSGSPSPSPSPMPSTHLRSRRTSRDLQDEALEAERLALLAADRARSKELSLSPSKRASRHLDARAPSTPPALRSALERGAEPEAVMAALAALPRRQSRELSTAAPPSRPPRPPSPSPSPSTAAAHLRSRRTSRDLQDEVLEAERLALVAAERALSKDAPLPPGADADAAMAALGAHARRPSHAPPPAVRVGDDGPPPPPPPPPPQPRALVRAASADLVGDAPARAARAAAAACARRGSREAPPEVADGPSPPPSRLSRATTAGSDGLLPPPPASSAASRRGSRALGGVGESALRGRRNSRDAADYAKETGRMRLAVAERDLAEHAAAALAATPRSPAQAPPSPAQPALTRAQVVSMAARLLVIAGARGLGSASVDADALFAARVAARLSAQGALAHAPPPPPSVAAAAAVSAHRVSFADGGMDAQIRWLSVVGGGGGGGAPRAASPLAPADGAAGPPPPPQRAASSQALRQPAIVRPLAEPRPPALAAGAARSTSELRRPSLALALGDGALRSLKTEAASAACAWADRLAQLDGALVEDEARSLLPFLQKEQRAAAFARLDAPARASLRSPGLPAASELGSSPPSPFGAAARAGAVGAAALAEPGGAPVAWLRRCYALVAAETAAADAPDAPDAAAAADAADLDGASALKGAAALLGEHRARLGRAHALLGVQAELTALVDAHADWAPLLLVGTRGHLERALADERAREAAAPSVGELLLRLRARECRRGARAVLAELLREIGRKQKYTPNVVLARVRRHLDAALFDAETAARAAAAAADAFVAAARIGAESDGLAGRLRVCAELTAWLSRERWSELQRRRVRLRGELSVSGSVKAAYKAAARALARLDGEARALDDLRRAAALPSAWVVLRVAIAPGAGRKGVRRSAAELRRAVEAGALADLANHVGIPPERLRTLTHSEDATSADAPAAGARLLPPPVGQPPAALFERARAGTGAGGAGAGAGDGRGGGDACDVIVEILAAPADESELGPLHAVVDGLRRALDLVASGQLPLGALVEQLRRPGERALVRGDVLVRLAAAHLPPAVEVGVKEYLHDHLAKARLAAAAAAERVRALRADKVLEKRRCHGERELLLSAAALLADGGSAPSDAATAAALVADAMFADDPLMATPTDAAAGLTADGDALATAGGGGGGGASRRASIEIDRRRPSGGGVGGLGGGRRQSSYDAAQLLAIRRRASNAAPGFASAAAAAAVAEHVAAQRARARALAAANAAAVATAAAAAAPVAASAFALAKRALAEAEGRAALLARLDAECPPRADARAARRWLPAALVGAEAAVLAMREAPARAYERYHGLYARRRALKPQLALVHAASRALAAAMPVAERASLCVAMREPDEAEGWRPRERTRAQRRLALALGRFAADALLAPLGLPPLAARGAQAAAWLRVKACAQLVPRKAVHANPTARVSPEAVRAMCARLGIALDPSPPHRARRLHEEGGGAERARGGGGGGGGDFWLAWLAVEALIAPLPPFWRERLQDDADALAPPSPRVLAASRAARLRAGGGGEPAAGDGAAGVSLDDALGDLDELDGAASADERHVYVHELTGEVLLEHPLLPAFERHVANERKRQARARSWAHAERFMLFASEEVDAVEIVDLATGDRLDSLPDPEPPHVRQRRLQQRVAGFAPLNTLSQLARQPPDLARSRSASAVATADASGRLIGTDQIGRNYRRLMRESRAREMQAMVDTATEELVDAVQPACAETLRLRPLALPHLFVAAGALSLDLRVHKERAFLAAFVLALRPTLPVGWHAHADAAGGPTRSYTCAFSLLDDSLHPFVLEMGERLDAASARAVEMLLEKDADEGVVWDDARYAERDGE